MDGNGCSPECKTAMYCTSTCLKKDYDGLYEGMPGHSFWCPHMKQYTEQTEELSKFPFSFAKGRYTADILLLYWLHHYCKTLRV